MYFPPRLSLGFDILYSTKMSKVHSKSGIFKATCFQHSRVEMLPDVSLVLCPISENRKNSQKRLALLTVKAQCTSRITFILQGNPCVETHITCSRISIESTSHKKLTGIIFFCANPTESRLNSIRLHRQRVAAWMEVWGASYFIKNGLPKLHITMLTQGLPRS